MNDRLKSNLSESSEQNVYVKTKVREITIHSNDFLP